MKVVIRANASSSIGIGHLMRCLALAQALHDAGDEVALLTSRGAEDLIGAWAHEGAAIQVVDVPTGSTDDADITVATARSLEASWLVVDGYEFGVAFHQRVRGAARVCVVDDHGAAALEADLITNGNIYATDELYPHARGRLVVGPRYAMLRREFRHQVSTRSRQGVLVSLGGADPGAHTEPLIAELTRRGITGRVVVGPKQAAGSRVRDRAAALDWQVIDAPPDMARVIRSSDLAIVGSGTTTLEVLALGTPMVVVQVAENQRPVAEALERFGLAAVTEGHDAASVADAASSLLGDAARRDRMVRRGRGLVDGRGAIRVAAAMREALLRLRPASLDDEQLLLDWRNDPETRTASFETAIVPPAVHRAWLEASLTSADRVMRIGEVGGRPVGVVRLDRRGDEAVVSITVAPTARGSGLANALLLQARSLADQVGISRLRARIRRTNVASIRAFAAAGFVDSPSEVGADDAVTMVTPSAGRR